MYSSNTWVQVCAPVWDSLLPGPELLSGRRTPPHKHHAQIWISESAREQLAQEFRRCCRWKLEGLFLCSQTGKPECMFFLSSAPTPGNFPCKLLAAPFHTGNKGVPARLSVLIASVCVLWGGCLEGKAHLGRAGCALLRRWSDQGTHFPKGRHWDGGRNVRVPIKRVAWTAVQNTKWCGSTHQG